jgi:hypothetical protein
MKKAAITVAILYVLMPLSVALADAISQFDDVTVSAAVMKECHIEMPPFMSGERTRAIGYAAYQQLWASFDAQGGSHDENGRQANLVLQKRTVANMVKGHELVTSTGCPALIPQAREALEKAYRQ